MPVVMPLIHHSSFIIYHSRIKFFVTVHHFGGIIHCRAYVDFFQNLIRERRRRITFLIDFAVGVIQVAEYDRAGWASRLAGRWCSTHSQHL